MRLEDRMYDSWKSWAEKQITAQRQLANSAYTGNEAAENDLGVGLETAVEEIQDAIPGTKGGQQIKGPAAIHP